MKKYLIAILCLTALALTLAGCRSGNAPEDPSAAAEITTEEETEMQTEADTEVTTEEETEAETEPLKYYICLTTGNLTEDVKGVYDTLDEAMEAYKSVKPYLGYRICDSDGNFVHANYTELQSDLLREAKAITQYIRKNKFKYGDAPYNPAMNHDAKIVSCDRLVCWIYYNAGFTDQPKQSGLVVSNFADWCEEHGFEKITRVEDLQPGDLVGVFPSDNGKYPKHVFMYAGVGKINEKNPSQSTYYRYDAGSDTRIQSNQPFCEPIVDFMFGYRPVWHTGSISKSDGTTVTLDAGSAAKLYTLAAELDWRREKYSEDWEYKLVIDGEEYAYDPEHFEFGCKATGKSSPLTADQKRIMKDVIKLVK